MLEWRLKKGSDGRLRSRHPWVFSNELLQSPRAAPKGELAIIRDYRGEFLAFGYAHPNSLISFRALSFSEKEAGRGVEEVLFQRLSFAWRQRKKLGFKHSYRLCFAEGDGLPGLVVDRYLLEGSRQCLVLQVSTAGMERLLELWPSLFKRLIEAHSDLSWDSTSLILRRDANFRKLEGLEILPSLVLHGPQDGLDQTLIQLRGPRGVLLFNSDLLNGQKTGFFLDQWQNIQWVNLLLKNSAFADLDRPFRILDLCSFQGHWSAQLASQLQEMGLTVEPTLVDVSADALESARQNLARLDLQPRLIKADVLEPIAELEGKKFDLIVSDPPAFIKAKKDIPTGKHAYLKLNTQAFQWLESGGILVACSCSGLLSEDEFSEILGKAARRAGKLAQVVARGGHGGDHPVVGWFPEGQYLKMQVLSV